MSGERRTQLPVPRQNRPPKLGPLGRPLMLVTSADDREFLPAALEILETPASPRRIAFIWLAWMMLGAAVVWSCLAKLDIFAVAPGRIQTVGYSKLIQSLDPGKVKAVMVENGSKVKAGDVLMELDPIEANADRDKASSDLEAIDAEIARRRTEIGMFLSGATAIPEIAFPANVGEAARALARKVFLAELSQYETSVNAAQAKLDQANATRDKLTSTLKYREQLVSVLQRRLQMRKELMDKQVGSLSNVLDAQWQLDQGLTDMATDKGQLQEAEAAAVAANREISRLQKQFIAEQSDKLSLAVKQRGEVEQELIKTGAKAKRMQLLSPIDGTVQQLAVTTIGQVVTSAQPLMVIVPNSGPMEIEALVPSGDFGFIKVGQKAVVKLDSFPFSRYGSLEGTVVRVAHDSVYDKDAAATDASTLPQSNSWMLNATPKTRNLVYPVWVSLDRNSIKADDREIQLSAGMTASIEIRTGSRRVIDYLLSPLREMASQAAHER